MKKVLVICGPTATGKTSVGISLAKKFNGEIVSADSRQIYQGLDIGTGKDLDEKSKSKYQISKINTKNQKLKVGWYPIDGVPVWLLDIVSPKVQFNVADWRFCADLAIKDIWSRGKLPIIVGGTGFYIKALTDDLETLAIPPDWGLRKKLEHLSLPELQKRLVEVNSEAFEKMNSSDRANPRRLIRKIEISLAKRKKPLFSNVKNDINFLPIGLTASRKIIYQKIDFRVKDRIKAGLIDEIKSLLEKGFSWADPGMDTLAYREFRLFVEGEETFKQATERWFLDECHYSKRQQTWFKKQKDIRWFDISKKGFRSEIAKLVERWYI